MTYQRLGPFTNVPAGTVPPAGAVPLSAATLDHIEDGLTEASAVTAQWAYLPKGWDATWKAAKAAQATTPAWMAFLGDSITAGQGASDWLTKAYASQTRTALLAAGNTLYGDHYPATVYGSGYGAAVGALPYTTLASNSISVEAGYGRSLLFSAGGSIVFTTPYACAGGLDIVYIDYGTGTFDYSLGGGAATTVTTATGSNPQNANVKKIHLAGPIGAGVALTLNNITGTAGLVLVGISCFATASSGIGFVRSGFSGIRATDLTMIRGGTTGADGGPSFPVDKIQLWQGLNPGGSGATTQTGFGFPTQPSLAVIAYGVNDMNLGAPLSMFKAALMRIIGALRRGVDNCSLVFLAPSDPSSTTYSDASPGGRSYDWHNYKRVMRDFAEAYNCAYLDIDAKWGNTPYAKGFLPAADVHPTDAGHADIGAILASIL